MLYEPSHSIFVERTRQGHCDAVLLPGMLLPFVLPRKAGNYLPADIQIVNVCILGRHILDWNHDKTIPWGVRSIDFSRCSQRNVYGASPARGLVVMALYTTVFSEEHCNTVILLHRKFDHSYAQHGKQSIYVPKGPRSSSLFFNRRVSFFYQAQTVLPGIYVHINIHVRHPAQFSAWKSDLRAKTREPIDALVRLSPSWGALSLPHPKYRRDTRHQIEMHTPHSLGKQWTVS